MRLASSKKTREVARQDVFNTIVALSQRRIVARLGLQCQTNPPGSKQKKFIGLRLEDFLRTNWQNKAKSVHPEMSKNDLKNYRVRSEALLSELYDMKSKDDLRHDDIAGLIRYIVEYLDAVPLGTLLECIPEQDMQQNARERLINCLSKAARYWESARFLCRRARRSQALNPVTVEEVHPLEESFDRPAATFAGTVQSVLSDLSNEGTLFRVHGLPQWAQKVIGSASSGQLAGAVNRSLRESKIHAEIQILAHYENASPDVLQPRVIASSKDACYLCDACIRIHGKHSVPKSHGRLYPGWRLPGTQNFESLHQKLNAFLEQEIRATLQRLSRANTKLPNESTIFPLHISASTLLTALSNTSRLSLSSHALPANAVGHGAVESRQEQMVTTSDELSTQTEGVSEQRSDTPRAQEAGTAPLVDAVDPEDKAADHSDAETVRLGEDTTQHRPDPETTERHAERPRESRSALSSSSEGQDGCWFRHGNMEVFLEPPSSELVPEWLSRERSAEVLRDRPELVFDVLSLPVGTDSPPLPKSSDGRRFFAFGDRVVVIDTPGRTRRKG